MVPLISEPLYTELRARRRTMPQQCAYVFLPVAQSKPQLLFIGQATAGLVYETELDFLDATKESHAMLEGFLGDPGGSLFWKTLCNVRNQVERIACGERNRVAVGWSNLCKIGAAEGNPDKALINAQSDLCVQALREELVRAKPEVTFLMTGHFAQEEILFPAFGRDGWRNNVPTEDKIALKQHPLYGILLWGYHPHDPWGMEHQRELIAFMAGFASARLLPDSLRRSSV
jgi:hypothetical protein